MDGGSEARFTAICKIFGSAAAVLLLAVMPTKPAAADPPAANSGGAAQVAQIITNPAYQPVYGSPVYNAPVMTPLDILAAGFGIYNAPTEPGRGWYFGPTGSLSALRDSDIIKRFESRSIDSLSAMSRSFTGTSANWGSNSSPWLRSSDSWLRSSDSFRLGSEGSKTKQLTSSLGYDVGARAGYQFNNFRTEFQFDYANNSVDTFGNPHRVTDFVMRERSVSGSTTGMTFLINGFLDVNVPYLSTYGATPYFGGGIGGGQTSLDLKVGNRTIVMTADGASPISSGPACVGRSCRIGRWISVTATRALATSPCATNSRRSASPIAATISRWACCGTGAR